MVSLFPGIAMRIHFACALSVILITGCGQEDAAPVRDSAGVENPPSSVQTSKSPEGRGEPEEPRAKGDAVQGFGIGLECRKEPEFKDLHNFGRLLID